MSLITIDEFNRVCAAHGGFATWLGVRLEEIAEGRAVMTLPSKPEFIRPGGVVAGPVCIGLADMAMYAAVMSIHERGLDAVTSDLTIHFLSRVDAQVIRAEARIIRSGRRLAVCEVWVYGDAEPEPVCHVTGSYSLPGNRALR